MNIFNLTSEVSNHFIQFNVKFSKNFLAIFLFFGSTSISQANIIVDTHAEINQQPSLIEHKDTATIINIQAANTEGISHNKYTQFDVDANGVVLNNFVSDQLNSSIASPLGNGTGNNIFIGNNELLSESGTARIILNEVTSLENPSQLNGPVAVAGQKADVIIANPAGIECNGCGFINSHIVNLSAGSPLLIDGSVQFVTDNITGKIVFNRIGLSKKASRSDYITLIANKININASVNANKGLYAKIFGNKDSMHEASLVSSELGGMYADNISISGTGENISVYNKGEIKSNVGLVLQVSGLLDSPGVISGVDYFDIAAKNFNTVFDKDESYSLAYIVDNVMNKKGTWKIESGIKSIMRDFPRLYQFPEQDKEELISIKNEFVASRG